MNLAFYIARRYLFAKKKHNAINVISAVATCGVALATLAMVCTLSVFNGFQQMVAGLFTDFDPELKITVAKGKVFDPGDPRVQQVRTLPEVAVWCPTIEENAMLQYKDRQAMAVVKGVDDNFRQLAAIDSLIYGTGEYLLHDSVAHYAIMGVDLMSQLGTGVQFVDPLHVYAPRQGVRINPANPAAAFNQGYLYSPGVVFIINQQKYDAHYLLTSLQFARQLFGYGAEVTAIELRLTPEASVPAVKQHIQALLGADFVVQDRYEQQADVFRIMEVEKLISFLFLTFILAVACFNIVGALSMLILDKRDDVATLHNLGASHRLIARVFLCEGCMISLLGAVIGIVGGLLLCWGQQVFGFISLGGGEGQFVVDAYPVSVQATDVWVVLLTVTAVSVVSVWWPVRSLSRRMLKA